MYSKWHKLARTMLLHRKRDDLRCQLATLRRVADELRQTELELQQLCSHRWERDLESGLNGTKRICRRCGAAR